MKVKARQKLHRLQAFVRSEPWLILETKLQEIVRVLDSYEAGALRTDFTRRKPSQFTIPEGSQIAVMNLFGTISRRQNAIMSESGGTSTEIFSKHFQAHVDDPEVSAIVIVADTPGGMVAGTPELSDLIYANRGKKPIKGLIDPMAASAGYWILSACDEVIAAPSATAIGSIGCVINHREYSKAEEKAGITTNIIRSSKNKAEGGPSEPLSDSARERMQAMVDEIGARFNEAVARNRGVKIEVVKEKFGQGATFMAREALERGLIDRIATFETLLSELSDRVGTASSISVVADTSFNRGASMHAKVRLALVQMGLCSYADEQKTADAALAGLFAAHGKQVPQDHDECEKQIRALAAPVAATPPPAAPAAAATTPTLPGTPAPGAQRQACDYISAANIHGIVMTAGHGLSDSDKLAVISELTTKVTAAGGQLPTTEVLDFVNKKAVAASGDTGSNVRISGGEAAIDKFHAEAVSAMCLAGTPGLSGKIVNPRTGAQEDFKPPKDVPTSAQAIAKHVLMICGCPAQRVATLDAHAIASLVMVSTQLGARQAEMLFGRTVAATWGNVTGMYQNVLFDAGNVQLRKAYTEVVPTYDKWATRGEDFVNYNPKHLVSVGVLPDPTAVGEDGEFDEVSTVDGKEMMFIAEWGEKATWSYKLLVNDTLGGVIGTFGRKMAGAFRRKENRLVYRVLKDNKALADGVALFNGTAVASGGHANLTTGSLANVDAYNSAFDTVKQKLGAQKAPGDDASPLGLKPKWVLHPPAQYTKWFEVLISPTKPGQSNPALPNVWENRATPIEDDELSAAYGGSDTAFYVLGDGNQCEHVLYHRMTGQNGPVFGLFEKPGALGYGVYAHEAFGSGAADFRNAQAHTGA